MSSGLVAEGWPARNLWRRIGKPWKAVEHRALRLIGFSQQTSAITAMPQ